MGTKGGLLVALAISAAACSGNFTSAALGGSPEAGVSMNSARHLLRAPAVLPVPQLTAYRAPSPAVFAGRWERIRVRPPVIECDLPDLEEGFAYVRLQQPEQAHLARLYPPLVTSVAAPAVRNDLPRLEEGFASTELVPPEVADLVRLYLPVVTDVDKPVVPSVLPSLEDGAVELQPPPTYLWLDAVRPLRIGADRVQRV